MADYYIRLGHFERARDVYEEGLASVVTVRDFSLIFDALVQFEESLVTAKMEQLGDGEVRRWHCRYCLRPGAGFDLVLPLTWRCL